MAIWKVTKYIKEITTVDADTRKDAIEESKDNDWDIWVTKIICVKIDNPEVYYD